MARRGGSLTRRSEPVLFRRLTRNGALNCHLQATSLPCWQPRGTRSFRPPQKSYTSA